MSSESTGATPRPDQHPLFAIDSSSRELADGLENAAQVLAAWAEARREEGADDSVDRASQLRRAAAHLGEAAALVSGKGSGGPMGLENLLRAAGGGAEGADLFGYSELFSVPDFVSILSDRSRDGVLEICAGADTFTVEFQQGTVVYVTGPAPRGKRLGDLLVKDGALDEEALECALGQKLDGEMLGETLLRLEAVEPAELEQALSKQMHELFLRMHALEEGFEFQFYPGRRTMPNSHARLGTAHLLLESARLLDENAREAEAPVEETLEGLGATWLAETGDDEGRLDVESFRNFVEVFFLEERIKLPCPPRNALRLLELTHSRDVDLDRIAAELEAHPVLSAYLLRAACAGETSSRGGALTLPGAARRLGQAELRKLAVSLVLNGRSFVSGSWQEMMDGLWRTAEIAGRFGALIGRECLGDAELGLVLALVQDIGKPAVLIAINDIEEECGCRLAPSAAKAVMDEYHQRAGAHLARVWSFPALAQVLEHHHDWDSLTDEARRYAQVALLSHDLALAVQRSPGPDLSVLAQSPLCEELGFDADLLAILLEECGDLPLAAAG